MRKVVLVVLVMAALAAGCGGDDDDEVDAGSQGDSSATTVELAAKDFEFDPATLDAEAGDTITVEVTNEGEAPHTFTVEELDIDEEIAPGESAQVEVTVPDSGGFEFVCRFHEGRGMIGAVGTPSGPGADKPEEDLEDDEDEGGSSSPGQY